MTAKNQARLLAGFVFVALVIAWFTLSVRFWQAETTVETVRYVPETSMQIERLETVTSPTNTGGGQYAEVIVPVKRVRRVVEEKTVAKSLSERLLCFLIPIFAILFIAYMLFALFLWGRDKIQRAKLSHDTKDNEIRANRIWGFLFGIVGTIVATAFADPHLEELSRLRERLERAEKLLPLDEHADFVPDFEPAPEAPVGPSQYDPST